jgi:transcription-repair coupling factor (superfamily II helicase)
LHRWWTKQPWLSDTAGAQLRLLARFGVQHTMEYRLEELWEQLAGRLPSLSGGVLGGVQGSLAAWTVAAHWWRRRELCVVVLPEQQELAQWQYDLSQLPTAAALESWTLQPKRLWERLRQLDAAQLRGIEIAARLASGWRGVLLCTPEVFSVPLPEPRELMDAWLRLEVGMELALEELLQRLLQRGFHRVDQVRSVGDIAWRGGIVDVFPLGWEQPLRIEWWGMAIESLRSFDPETQRSTATYEAVEFLAALLWEHTPATIADYLPEHFCLILEQPERCAQAAAGRPEYALVQQRTEPIRLNPLQPAQEVLSRPQPSVGRSVVRLVQELERLAAEGYELYLCAADAPQLRRFRQLVQAAARGEQELSQEHDSPPELVQRIHWVEGAPARGFLWSAERIAVWTEHEVFHRQPRQLEPARRYSRGLTLAELEQLRPGEYVVHVDHGIGIFDGLQVLTLGGVRQECVRLRYADGDILYVPLEYVHKLQRYQAHEGARPRLHRLGDRRWQLTKARVRRRARELARELIRLYAERKLRPGFAFPPDTLWQREMEAAFPYEETPDQARATAEVKADMESAVPMDRLICGDVGFGKTEVAIRAAFKAVQAGKQVAVLVPTTILAEQHALTFAERLRPYPVVIATLSRFRSRREQREVLQQLERGHIDIIIGTHRLLSPDVRFRDLGLLIIDEEHRFGVMAKERLRQLQVTVDTLTLSATPIPRTLHMALIGVRDMSLIETPPRNRLPVRTYVVQWDDEFIRQAILLELERGGQVFFVTNHIEGIERLRERLCTLLPQARIAVAHGRMRSNELESVMEAFLHQRLDVLVCTKIVESGLDFPNANTIFIHHAEDFGLAELYQLRGRVGRSNVQAYCYLITPPLEQLSSTTLRRLQALEEFTELGSGFRLALRDLELRGAGNLFGAEQSGFIAQIGFELYQQILEQAIEELRESPQPQRQRPVLELLRNPSLLLEIGEEALLPDSYVPSEVERFQFYKRLYCAQTEAEVDDIAAELRDRFGPLPPPAERLLEVVRLRVYLVHSGCVRAIWRENTLQLELPARSRELFYRYAFPVLVQLVSERAGAEFRQQRQRIFAVFPLQHRAEALELARALWEELVCALHHVTVPVAELEQAEELS